MTNVTKENQSLSQHTNEELFVLYRSTGRLDIKQELALRYLPIVKSIALQMRNVYVGFEQAEDIINEGVIILMKEIDRYDTSKNAKFETFVSKRLKGMIIDLARKQDWVPRGVRKTYKDINETITAFYTEFGREPSQEEVAKILHIEEERYESVMGKANLFSILSLDMALEETSEQRKTTQIPSDKGDEQPEESYLDRELKQTLIEGIHTLNQKEQLVVSLYYVEEINMKEIATVMELSEPRVSQIHAAAINKLRDYISQ